MWLINENFEIIVDNDLCNIVYFVMIEYKYCIIVNWIFFLGVLLVLMGIYVGLRVILIDNIKL